MSGILWPAEAAGWLVLAASLALFAGIAVLGAAAAPGPRLRAADPVAGLGFAAGLLTLLGSATRLPLSLWYGALAALMLAAGLWLWRRRRPVATAGLPLAVLLILPLLGIAAAAPATLWDDFMHWLLNAAYLYRFDSFPHAELPRSPSVWPAYPYTLPLWVNGASLLAGRWVENAAQLLNLLLSAAMAPLFVAVVEAVRGPLPRRAALALTALLVPFATLLSPSFDLAFALSSYADHATAVAAATAAVLGWRGLDALAAGERPAARALAWQFGLALALILNLKQTGPVVAALLLGGLGLIVLRDPRLRLRDALAMLPAMVLPGLLVYGVWRLYVGANIPGGETVVRPLAAWHLHIVPEILASAWKQMREHPAHFLLMWGAALYGGYAFLRMRDGLDRLAALTAIVWLGFTAFMGIAYLSMFSEPESKEAAQYWRYSGQVGLLGSVLAVALLARHWPSRWRQALRPAAATAAIAFPLAVIVLAESLSPALRPLPRAFREFGREMAEILPDNARVASLEPWGYGLMYFAVKYDLWRPGRDDRGLRVVKQIDFLFSKAEENLPWTAAAFADPGVTHIVINDTPPEYAAILGIPPQKATAVLLEKGEAGWRIVKSWPRRPGPNGKTE